MDTAARREQLMIYLADATDKKVNALYIILEEEIKGNDVFALTDAHIDILEKRRAGYISGKAIPVPWQEAHERIRNKRKSA